MTFLFREIGRSLHRLIPKRRHAVIWCWPDGEDNGVALEQALQFRDVDRVVLLNSEPAKPAGWTTGAKTIRVKKNSFRGLFWFLTAKFVFFTHPCFTRRYPKDVVSVNVWHGMPVKKIGSMLPGDGEMACSHTLATSPFWGEIMQRAMNPGGEVCDTGLPRNDRLFCAPDVIRGKLGIAETQKLLIWLPTYRTSLRGLPRTDGLAAGNVFEMPDLDPEKLNDWLASRELILIVKPHPMAENGQKTSYSNLWIINHQWLCEKGVSLYQILGTSAVLISDISSVVIDYLILDRPVIHAFPDLEVYKKSRGFTVEPIEDHLAGVVVTNQNQLVEALSDAISGTDPGMGKRHALRRLSHTHTDSGSTKRILDLIGLKETG